MNTISLIINGRPVRATRGTTILAAAAGAGVVIPTLCHSERLESTGSCWMCIVELKGRNRFVPACSTTATDGMEIETENAESKPWRREKQPHIQSSSSSPARNPRPPLARSTHPTDRDRKRPMHSGQMHQLKAESPCRKSVTR
jgi:glutamate synthase (NADPH/NADH) small chain